MRARHLAAILICGFLGTLGVLQLLGDGGLIGWVLAGFWLLGARFWLRPRAGELGLVARCFGTIVAVAALFVAGLFAAWESAEVVVLRYHDERGAPLEARLWVIDLDGRPSVAMGSAKRRVEQIQARPEVELVRGGRAECRRAVVVEASAAGAEERRAAERLFAAKCGFRVHGSRALRFVFGALPGEEPTLIRLEPC